MNRAAAERFCSAVVREGLYARREDLRFYLDTLFRDIELVHKRVLDIGGGSGLYSFYAAAMGAAEVVCLEPEADGSRRGVSDHFEILRRAGIVSDSVVARVTSPLDSFERAGPPFDVILLRNAINHLDEDACIRLAHDARCRETYRRLFARIAALAAPGATLLVRDCSSRNLFAHLGLRNPFAPTIEWHKHHPPEVWLGLLSEVGFDKLDLWWPAHRRSPWLRRPLVGSRFMSYLLTSHFCFTMTKA